MLNLLNFKNLTEIACCESQPLRQYHKGTLSLSRRLFKFISRKLRFDYVFQLARRYQKIHLRCHVADSNHGFRLYPVLSCPQLNNIFLDNFRFRAPD